MKKLILSAVALATFGLANAQLGTAGFMENWDNTEYENTLYWWSPEEGADAFDFTTSRGDDGTTVTFTQKVGGFQPFGISFGEDTINGVVTPNTIDMSGDKTFGFTVVNMGSESIQIRVTLQDPNENTVDTYPSAIADGDTTTEPWNHAMEFDLDANDSLTFTDTWADALKANYDANGTFTGVTADLDYTTISGMQITVINADDYGVNGDANGENAYAHKGLTDYQVKFTSIYAGDTTTIEEPNTGTGVAELKASIGLSVAPNPATSVVNVAFEGAATVTLSSVLGDAISTETAVGSVSFDVDGLAAGSYYVTVATADVVVTEAIIVE